MGLFRFQMKTQIDKANDEIKGTRACCEGLTSEVSTLQIANEVWYFMLVYAE